MVKTILPQPLTTEQKADIVDNALDQLVGEIAADAAYDAHTAVRAFNAIDQYSREASEQSKARLYDIIKGC